MRTGKRKFLIKRIIASTGFVLAISTSWAWASDAEVILVIGQGERRDSESASWQPAAPKHKVVAGGFVRTLAQSQMGLLLPDRTQIRLNQNSMMQIKTATDAAQFTQTQLKLNAGRAWSQARPAKAPESTADGRTRIAMETPTATLSIRGTDWEVEVLPDGTTQLVVLSGVVDLRNEVGVLQVEPGERALAAPGKMPVKSRLVDFKQRVQWVSRWQAKPERWGGEDAGATVRLAADEKTRLGEPAQAARLLEEHLRAAPDDLLGIALHARILALIDRLPEARESLRQALERQPQPQQVELLVAAGDLAILDGDLPAARAAFNTALLSGAQQDDGWFGLGRIESELGNIRLARELLDRALGVNPALSDARAERAVVDTAANAFAAAERDLAQLLAEEPANLVALTALGINHLKRGQPEQALEAFLKAGTIEPRYARAWLYSAAAFYQMDDTQRALQALHKAAELDPRDPLPHLLESLVSGDGLQLSNAIMAAQRARELFPNLKSLDQVANDQKGRANLGSALANFGFEEWSAYQAYYSANPFWAGSQFFSADRQVGKFNKNSALYLGYLTDPTVFGASPRNSDLIAAPGHYASVDLAYERTDWSQKTLNGTLNGMIVEPFPLAYFLSADLASAKAVEEGSTADGRQRILGIGARPRYDFGIFGFSTAGHIAGTLRTQTLPEDAIDFRDGRTDLGFSYKPDVRHQFWFKIGNGNQVSQMDGIYDSPEVADILNRLFGGNYFESRGHLDWYEARTTQEDLQLRYSMKADTGLLTVGAEVSRAAMPARFGVTYSPLRMTMQQRDEFRADDLYVSWQQRVGQEAKLAAGLWFQHGSAFRSEMSGLGLAENPPGSEVPILAKTQQRRHSEANPRLGLAWQLEPGWLLRAVSQHWRRPATISSLGDIDTLGIAINDRMVMTGGKYRRNRLQLDGEAGSRTFLVAFLDHERVDNGLSGVDSVVPSVDLNQLEALKRRRQVFAPFSDLEETPEYPGGRVITVGTAANFLLSERHGVTVRYLWRDSRQTGAGGDSLRVPYLPRHQLRIGSQWNLPERWVFGVSATYRSMRYQDSANREPLLAGWSGAASLYWESADKRNAFQAIVDNVVSRSGASFFDDPYLTLRYTHRF